MGTKATMLTPKTTPRPEFIPALPDDALAAFEAEGEDRENDLCDEPNGDRELDQA